MCLDPMVASLAYLAQRTVLRHGVHETLDSSERPAHDHGNSHPQVSMVRTAWSKAWGAIQGLRFKRAAQRMTTPSTAASSAFDSP
jgi:hypothetical protein